MATKARREFRVVGGGQVTWDPDAISAVNKQTTTMNIPGAKPGDAVLVTPDVITNGVAYSGYVSAASTVTIVAMNASAGSINPGSTVFTVVTFRL